MDFPSDDVRLELHEAMKRLARAIGLLGASGLPDMDEYDAVAEMIRLAMHYTQQAKLLPPPPDAPD